MKVAAHCRRKMNAVYRTPTHFGEQHIPIAGYENPRTTLTTARRRGGRVVECTALEMRHSCKGNVASSPRKSQLSATTGGSNAQMRSQG